jgi:cell wall-associated NlpC family hydrolase
VLSGLVLAGVVLTPLASLTATPAGAQEIAVGTSGPARPSAVAARLVAERRAAEHRRQADLAREQVLATLAQLAAQAQTARVAPVLDAAVAKLGRPYVRGAAGPNAFDCSGFTRWAWQAAGVELPHYSGAQWAQTDHISVDDLQPGDLVFFWGPGERGDPGHVGLYVGDGQMIHAPGTGRSVRYDSIWYWSGARVAAGRVR